MAIESREPDGYVLLFYFEENFAARRDELEPLLAKTSAYLLRHPYFFRSRAEPAFLLVSIPEYDWSETLSLPERTALRAASEAVYLSRGYPPSE